MTFLARISLESGVIAVTGWLIVFSALLLLFWLFSLVPKLIAFGKSHKSVRQGKEPVKEKVTSLSGEEAAAIAMALNLYIDVHDPESGVVTIKRISKSYSPWSSKIYAVRNQFNRL